MKKILALALVLVSLAAGFIAGNIATRKAAVYVGNSTDGGYIISYRFGSYWQNDLYMEG